MAYANTQPVYNPKNTNENIIIGGRSFTREYANDPNNQEEIRQAVVGGGNDINVTSNRGITNNLTGNTIDANSNGVFTSTGSSYVNSTGNKVTPYSERNSVGTVAADSVFDINNPNTYNAKIANSSGRINMMNEGDYDNNGGFTGKWSGSKSETDSQAFFNKIMNGGADNNNSSGGGSSSGSYGGGLVGGSSFGGGSSMDLNAQLVQAQKANKLAGLTGAYNASNSNLDKQASKIDPQAYIDRGQKSTASQLGAKSFAEFLASRNQSSSGMANQSELTRNMQLQGDIGSIDLQARGMHNNIATSKTDLANALQTDTAAANAGIEADSLSRQIQLMQQEQARQDQINQFNKSFDYNASRDLVGDNRYNTETAYNQSRDTIGDNRYDTETQYNQGQNLINQTGQFANGDYTQSGQMNQLNIQTQQAQLAEMQNPNSTTNQMAKLGLDTARLNFAALPAQLKAQAQQIAQQLSQGAIDMKTAQIKLDYLPQMMQQEMAQNKAQLAATNRSNQPSSGGGGGANGTYTKTEIGDQAWSTFINEVNNGTGEEWLSKNSDGIIKSAGSGVYLSMVQKLKTLPVSQKAQTVQYNDARKQHTLDYNRQPQ